MRRVLLAGFALLAIGIGAGFGIALAFDPQAQTTTVTTTKIAVINGSRSAGRIPAPIPSRLEGSTDPHALVLSSAVPIDATLDSADYVDQKPSQLIVTWERAHLTRDGSAAIWQRRGMAIWQLDRRHQSLWHRVYTFETPLNNQVGVHGFGVTLGDISGDGRREILVFFDTDGSAGGGSYHVFASAGDRIRQPLVRELALDQGTIGFARGRLVVLEGVDFRGHGIHCCYRKVRERWLRWSRQRLVKVRELVRRNQRGWPPG